MSEVESIIRRLEEDPDDPEALAAARDPAVFAVFIRRCLVLVDSDARQGIPMLDTATRVATSSCEFVQIYGVRAGAYRALGRASQALALLDSEILALLAGDCGSCRAHVIRQRSKALASLGRSEEALSTAELVIEIAHQIEHVHDLHDNGLANAYFTRGDVRQFIGERTRDESLLQGAVEDFSTALSLADPNDSPSLYLMCLSALAVVLYYTGKRENLEKADSYIRRARQRFRGPQKPTKQRAKLAWLAAMVRHELGEVRPARIDKILDQALDDFAAISMPQELSAVASDKARIVYPERDRIRQAIGDARDRLEHRFDLPDLAHGLGEIVPLRAALDEVTAACDLGWAGGAGPRVLRSAIEGLRVTCGPDMLACLVRWREEV